MIRTSDALNAFLDRPALPVVGRTGGPLAGLTLAVKDIFDVQGWRTGCGNPQKLDESGPAPRNAWAVEKLLDAGAEFAGKTQTDELAFSLFGQNSHFPYPINPRAPDRITGGSSSGSAAAVAGGLTDIALGSDTGGSVRAPAGFCGLWGLRPTHGRLSLDGVMPLAPSLDTVGFFARDVQTFGRVAAVLLDAAVIQGGPVRLLGSPALDELVLPSARAEYGRLTGLVEDVLGEAFPLETLAVTPEQLYWCFRRIQGFEAWRAHGPWLMRQDRQLGPGVKERFEVGAQVTPEAYDAETALRKAFRAELAGGLGEDGVLLLPTVPGAAPLAAGDRETFDSYRERALTMLCWSGLSGFPQVAMPLGHSEAAPFGISLLGPPGSDGRLVALAAGIVAVS